MTYYLDSSAWVKRYFEETGSDWVDSLFEGGHLLSCSTLGLIEVMATAARKRAAGAVDAAGIVAAYITLSDGNLETFWAADSAAMAPLARRAATYARVTLAGITQRQGDSASRRSGRRSSLSAPVKPMKSGRESARSKQTSSSAGSSGSPRSSGTPSVNRECRLKRRK
jgi:hypothetical protein